MPFYSEKYLTELCHGYAEISGKRDNLLIDFMQLPLANERAREYSLQGFSRRVRILVRCIHNVFAILPPERDDPPTMEENADATISIQTFMINVFGAIDNLAWIWVCEKNVTDDEGNSLPNRYVGLGARNSRVRKSFSKEFQEYLETMAEWFEGMGDFRDGLAHRFSSYIPPYTITQE